jgi:signal transduction histidine kinase
MKGWAFYMNKLLDKLLLFILCIVFYVQSIKDAYMVVPVICVISASAAASYIDRHYIRALLFIAFCMLSLAFPMLLFFLPLLCYDAFSTKWNILIASALVPLAVDFSETPLISWVFILIFIFLAFFLQRRTASLDRARQDYNSLRDSAKEMSLKLESKNKELLEKQDYEINLATLNERNRIARDIHDTVGHLLSNSILQTGALIALSKDEAEKERLYVLKDTLSQGMDSIRESIHNLHDESIDLQQEVQNLTDGFSFCEISLVYHMDSNPDKKIKYAMIAVLKEALSNIIKHSDATFVQVTLREHPALYQLLVRDNGSKKQKEDDEGIGLNNIKQRVGDLGGILNIEREKGFLVFISIPKE